MKDREKDRCKTAKDPDFAANIQEIVRDMFGGDIDAYAIKMAEGRLPRCPKNEAPERVQKSYEPFAFNMTPGRLRALTIQQILNAYCAMGQPCLIYGGNETFTIHTAGITYDMLKNLVKVPWTDFVLFTDGNNITKLK